MNTAQASSKQLKLLDYDEPNSILSQRKTNTNQSSKRKLESAHSAGARTPSNQNVKHKAYFETLEILEANKDSNS